MKLKRDPVPPGGESVWDYPRPPRVELSDRLLEVILAGHVVAKTDRAHRVLETSHPPVYYLPASDVDMTCLRAHPGQTHCEFKGVARYFDVVVASVVRPRAAWSYPNPSTGNEPLRDAIAFYAGPFDRCTVGGEIVTPQQGEFYGGWITSDLGGPFKGGPGTEGW